MSINTKRKTQSVQLPNIKQKVEEEISSYLSQSDYSQIQSNYERCDEKARQDQKSTAVLTFFSFPLINIPTKRIKLNDQLCYSFIPSNHNIQNHNSSTTLFSYDKLQKGNSSYIQNNAYISKQKDEQKSISDYENYVQSFPDFRIGTICCYKMKIDLNQRTSQNNQRQYSPAKLSDYQNLILLFSNQHFSVQIIYCEEILNKCIDFIQNHRLNEFYGDQLQQLSPFEAQISSQQQCYNIFNENKNNENNCTSNNTSQLINKKQLQCGKTLNKKDSVQIDENKNIKNNSYYQLLLKNIQYTIIKEITGIQKIEFSKKTVSKLINKFILFLKGDYRSLKFYDLDQSNNKEQNEYSRSKDSPSNKNNNQYYNIQVESNIPETFEIPVFNLFELLDEQDQKEFPSSSSNQNNSRSKKAKSNDKQIVNQARSQLSQHSQIKTQSLDSHLSSFPSQQQQNLKNLMNFNINWSNICQFQSQACQFNNTQKEKIKYEQDEIPNQCDQFSKIKENTKLEHDSSNELHKQPSISNEQSSTSKNQNKQKRTLFNLSKYLMHLILEYLSGEHLDGLNLIPGFLPLVQNVIERIKKKGQRTEHSQTYYYNHSHYNCLFLLLNANSIEQIQKQDELFLLHQYVFEITDFNQPYQLTQINIIKSIITRLIIKQFKIIRYLIDINKQTNPSKYSNYQNYMITKLQYFERVYQGIQNLKKGFFLVRF